MTCLVLTGHMIFRLVLSVRWGSESSSECGGEVDFVSDSTTVATDSVEKHNGILSIVVLEIVTNLLCARRCIGL